MKTCPHLEPIERELAARSIPLGEGQVSPYGAEWGTWFSCDCVFDAAALRARLGLADCVRYDEYDGRVAGHDATFYCQECKRAIMGPHPSYARPSTPRVA